MVEQLPIGREDRAELLEVGRKLRSPHVLEHPDRCDGVELARDVSIVQLQDLDTVFQIHLFDPDPGELRLLGAEGDTGGVDAVSGCCVDHQPSPAAPDIEEPSTF